jgi:hypothetical protein
MMARSPLAARTQSLSESCEGRVEAALFLQLPDCWERPGTGVESLGHAPNAGPSGRPLTSGRSGTAEPRPQPWRDLPVMGTVARAHERRSRVVGALSTEARRACGSTELLSFAESAKFKFCRAA